ncbi:glycosyltransferase family A protein [Gangjinia marincola]|uniref:Glycosyltransferase family A protein n=2 Tax=Gangjinia marincola TaxID=578463 RepID=A0ABN1MDS3_9FLAO
MTYMHEEFIDSAMDGIMMQQYDGHIEVVVGDDFSTDNTLKIIKSYADTDRIKIKILERSKGDGYWQKRQQLGRLYNFANIIENCTGDYIALLDGDDYWTDPLKLQKQVDFLKKNTHFVISGHDAYVVDENNNQIDSLRINESNDVDYTEHQLKCGAFLLSLSIVYRNVIKTFPKEFFEVNNGDTFLIALLGEHGKGKFLSTIRPASYRIHSESIWSSRSEFERRYNRMILFHGLYSYFHAQKDHEMSIYYNKQLEDFLVSLLSYPRNDEKYDRKKYMHVAKIYFNHLKPYRSWILSKYMLRNISYFLIKR